MQQPDLFAMPLARWSDLNRETADLHLAVGRVYGLAIGGAEPTPAVVADLRARLERVRRLLDEATR